MKILGIMGSPRVGGNSDILLDDALAGAKDAGAQRRGITNKVNNLKVTIGLKR